MNAQQFMDQLIAKLRDNKKLDQDVADVVIERILAPDRQRDAAETLAIRIENIALGRASKKNK
jgi:hypothetical protein